jgi:hypothetical protein
MYVNTVQCINSAVEGEAKKIVFTSGLQTLNSNIITAFHPHIINETMQ